MKWKDGDKAVYITGLGVWKDIKEVTGISLIDVRIKETAYSQRLSGLTTKSILGNNYRDYAVEVDQSNLFTFREAIRVVFERLK